MRRRHSKLHDVPRVVTDRNSPLFDELHYEASCAGKMRYDTDWQAKYEAEQQGRRAGGITLSWYHCPYCGFWHLTSRL